MRSPIRAVEAVVLVVVCLLAVQVVMKRREVEGLAAKVVTAEARAAKALRTVDVLNQHTAELGRLLSHARLVPGVRLTGKTLDGRMRTVALDSLDAPTAIFVIDAHCSTCYANAPLLQRAVENAPCSVSVIGVSLNDTLSMDSWGREAAGFDVLLGSTGSAWRALPLGSPSSILLAGRGGTIGGWWSGGIVAESSRARFAATLDRVCSNALRNLEGT